MLFWDQVIFSVHSLSVATVLFALGHLLFLNGRSHAWRVVCWICAVPPMILAVGFALDIPVALESIFDAAMKASLVISSPFAAVAAVAATRSGRITT